VNEDAYALRPPIASKRSTRSFLAGFSAAGSASLPKLLTCLTQRAKASRRSSGVSRTEADW